MSSSLKANFLFFGRHWTVYEFHHERNLYMKGDYSLSDLKIKKIKT